MASLKRMNQYAEPEQVRQWRAYARPINNKVERRAVWYGKSRNIQRSA